ncbi:MAG: DUF1311 domain-containing protein [Saprospiraceae bacterium]|nr:DUF1311 domain-containing protein [Saprospiraceae bacterium]
MTIRSVAISIAFKSTVFLLLFSWLGQLSLLAQGTADSKRLGELEYMAYADRINCDSMMGTSLESRVCLNLAFQRADSTMVELFHTFIKGVESKSLQEEFLAYQEQWLVHRRRQSKWVSEGYRGHMLGIVYLNQMLSITEWRIEELKALTQKEK